MAEILNEWTYRRAKSGLRRTSSSHEAVELAASVAGYEALKFAGDLSLELGSLSDLGRALVKARIAKGWSQARLARELGMPKQQVQRYEAMGYASASLSRVAEVARALGMTFAGKASCARPAGSPSAVARMLAGFAAAETVQAAERRVRLHRLTVPRARRIYDDLCATYYRLAPLQRTAAADERDGIAHRLNVQRAIAALARKQGLTR